MAELAGRLAEIRVGGTPMDAAGLVLERIDDNTWRVETAAARVLVAGVVVEWDDGGWTTISYEDVNLLTGVFTFGGAGYGPGEDLRIESGQYIPLSTAAYAHDFSINKMSDLHDVTRFLDAYRRRIPGLKSASGSLSQFDVESSFFEDVLISGDPVVIEFIPTPGESFRMWAMLENTELQAAIESPQEESVSFSSKEYWV